VTALGGDVTARTTVVACVVLVLLLAGFGLFATMRRLEGSVRSHALVQWIGWAQAVWRAAGMRYKVKALVGFFQCVSAVSSVYNVVRPVGLEEYTGWINVLELPSELENIVIASACLGEYHKRLLLGSLWPVVLTFIVTANFVGWELVLRCRHESPQFALPQILVSDATGGGGGQGKRVGCGDEGARVHGARGVSPEHETALRRPHPTFT
jgi:hypothetical protein